MEEYDLHLVKEYFSKPEMIEDYDSRVARGLLTWEKTMVGQEMMEKGTVLDVGCGCGREAFALHDLGYTVTGVDVSRRQLEQASKNAEASGREIKFILCDGLNYDFPDDTFSYVLIWQQVLGNVSGKGNRLNLLQEALRVLKPNGKLVLSVHDAAHCIPIAEQEGLILNTGNEENDFLLREPFGNQCYWHYFSKPELVQLVSGAGFTVTACEYSTHYGMESGWETILVCIAQK